MAAKRNDHRYAACLSTDPEWIEINGEGTLLTYSIVNYGPSGFEDSAPYILGVSDFGNGIKIFSFLSKEIPENDVKVGMKVKVFPVKLSDDRVIYEFRKA